MLEFIQRYFHELWWLVLEMSPWLLLGLIFAGLLKIYFPQKHIEKFMGKSNFRSAINGSLLGVPMPLCSCGVIPTAISFYKSGASKGATNSFLISTPQTGIDSIFATYSMLGWPFAILRPLIAFVTGVAGGALTNWVIKEKPVPKNSQFSGFQLDTSSIGKNELSFVTNPVIRVPETKRRHSLAQAADYAFIELLQDIAKWLIMGFLIAALISVVLPNDFFSSFKGLGIIEILVVLAASVPIYICATGSIPIAAVLLMKGVSPGAALVFLMAGPATNVATMTVLGKVMGRKSLLVYMFAIISGAVIFGMLTNLFIPTDWILSKMLHVHGEGKHQMIPAWIQWISSIFLISAIIGGFFYLKYSKLLKMNKLEGTTLKVTGMTCSHCEATVKKNLESIDGISEVVANNGTNSVKITGTNINLEKVKLTINGLGYKYEGTLD